MKGMKLLRRILCAVSLFFFMLGQWKEAAVDGVPLKTSCRCCGCHRSLSSAAAARKQSAAKRAAAIAEARAEGKLAGAKDAEAFTKPLPQTPEERTPRTPSHVPNSGEAKIMDAHLPPEERLSHRKTEEVQEAEDIVHSLERTAASRGSLRGSEETTEEE